MSEHDISEEEEDFLLEEKVWCMENLRFLTQEYNRLIDEKNRCGAKVAKWTGRYEKADRKLAMATKLTVVDVKKRSKDPDVRALERVLKDPSQAQALIDLLREEVKEDAN